MTELDSIIKSCVIAAGGKGTRLSTISGNKPKALATVLGREIIFDQIEKFIDYGCKNFFILLGFKAEIIQSAIVKRFETYEISITYLFEDIPLGSGGSLLYHVDKLPYEFLFTYCDIFFDFEIEKLVRFHREKNSGLTLVTHPNDHPFDSDLVSVNDDEMIMDLFSHPHTSETFPGNLVNAAFYIIIRENLKKLEKTGYQDFEQDLVPLIINNTSCFAYTTHQLLKDIGTPERLGWVEKNHFTTTREMGEKVIFIDRDGTLNLLETGQYIREPNELVLIDGVGAALKKMRNLGYFIVLVTNQPVIARGEVTYADLRKIHARLDWLLAKDGAYIDYKFLCPHHPHTGYSGEIPSLKIECNCRKPKIGLFHKASQFLEVNISASWMVGDSESDIVAGKSFGLQTCRIAPVKDKEAAITCKDLLEFCDVLEKLT